MSNTTEEREWYKTRVYASRKGSQNSLFLLIPCGWRKHQFVSPEWLKTQSHVNALLVSLMLIHASYGSIDYAEWIQLTFANIFKSK